MGIGEFHHIVTITAERGQRNPESWDSTEHEVFAEMHRSPTG
jgi:hypothetical protein